jgi:uncharacterized protein YcbK (DUF882 family)
MKPSSPPSRRAPFRALLAAGAAAAALALTPVYADAGEIVHVVARGQTLGRIAKRYHVSVEAIREANDLAPGERIHPGLALKIPAKGHEADAAKGAADHGGKRDKPEKTDRAKKGARAPKDEPVDQAASFSRPRGPVRHGFVRMTRGADKLEVQLLGHRGHLAPAALAGLGNILRFAPTGARTPIDPRLAALIGAVSDHFGGRTIHVVSGFRPYSPAQYTPHSNHNVGRAMDFSIEGVPNTVVRDFCRTFRNAGVGYYPNSSFVHLDVRTGKAYWVDYSHPGEAPHYDSPNAQHTADEAARDVEPHPGAGDAGDPSPAGDPGSSTTP